MRPHCLKQSPRSSIDAYAIARPERDSVRGINALIPISSASGVSKVMFLEGVAGRPATFARLAGSESDEHGREAAGVVYWRVPGTLASEWDVEAGRRGRNPIDG